MSEIRYKNGKLHMEGVALETIAKEFGTPAYCYSATTIENKFRAWQDAMAKARPPGSFTICYAAKANSNLAVLKLLGQLGAGADIVSGGELARALKAGIPASRIVYSGVGKSAEELEAAIRRNIFQINAESAPELELISEIATRLRKKVNVAIRVNPNVDAKTHAKITTGRKENKFGIDIELAPALYRRAARLPGIKACGVAVHIGSQLTKLDPFRRAYVRVAELVRTLRRQGNGITRVDLGGGMGITYHDEVPPDLYLYALMAAQVFEGLDVHLVLEPGRSVVGNAGVLLSRVVQVKHGTAKKFLILDAAMNDLLRPALYDAYHAIIPLGQSKAPRTVYDIVGPVCETGDTFLVDQKMPGMRAGDLVAILSAGAYGAVMSSNYNTRPLAPEILVRGSKRAAIRKRQSVADILKAERVPPWI